MVLALESGIAPSVWADEGIQAIDAAFELLEERRRREQGKPEPLMSG